MTKTVPARPRTAIRDVRGSSDELPDQGNVTFDALRRTLQTLGFKMVPYEESMIFHESKANATIAVPMGKGGKSIVRPAYVLAARLTVVNFGIARGSTFDALLAESIAPVLPALPVTTPDPVASTNVATHKVIISRTRVAYASSASRPRPIHSPNNGPQTK